MLQWTMLAGEYPVVDSHGARPNGLTATGWGEYGIIFGRVFDLELKRRKLRISSIIVHSYNKSFLNLFKMCLGAIPKTLFLSLKIRISHDQLRLHVIIWRLNPFYD